MTWQAWRDDRTAVSLYGAYADGGEGRNAGYAAPKQGDSDWEIRGWRETVEGRETPRSRGPVIGIWRRF